MMSLKSVIFGVILFEVATNSLAKGLQCYVCEDCNEHEDFKELQICGEIPIDITTRPPRRTTVASSSNPTEKTVIDDDYLYEDSSERLDNLKAPNSTQKNATREDTIEINEASGITTQKPTSLKENYSTQNPTTLARRPIRTTTQSLVQATNASSKLTTRKNDVVTTAKPIEDYDDYMEYEDSLKMKRSERTWKMNEPVCYMIRYHANNTSITNRGCTTFINASKYSTCETLYNGASKKACRLCSSNGCNKFLKSDGYDNSYGILISNAAAPQQFGIFALLLWITCGRAMF